MNVARWSSSAWLAPSPTVCCILMIAEIAWFAANFRAPVGPPILGSLPVFLGTAVVTVSFARAWHTPGITTNAMRFWRALTVGAAVLTLGQLIDLPQAWLHPVVWPSTVSFAMYLAVVVGILVALYRLPLGARVPSERTRLLLDSATVTLAAVLTVLYPSLATDSTARIASHLMPRIISIGLLAIIILGVVKVLLANGRTIDPMALRMLGAGFLTEVAGIPFTTLVVDRPQIASELLGRSGMYWCIVVGAEYQRRSAGLPEAQRSQSKRRPFSLIPYLAVMVANGVLLFAVRTDPIENLILASGTVALTVLVIVRQLATFRENIRLADHAASQERRFRSLVQNAADVIAIIDRYGVPAYVSPGVERLTGRPPTSWVGSADPPVQIEDLPLVATRFREVLASAGATVSYDIRLAHATEGWRWIHVTHTNCLDDPAVNGIVTNVSDITGLRAYHDQLTYQANHDPLTELANRTLLHTKIRQAIDRGYGEHLWLAFIDLDDFKVVNDTFGHQVGDGLLITVADLMRTAVRPGDLVVRLGGDEFAVLLDDVDPDRMEDVVKRILATLSAPVSVEGHTLRARASIGVTRVRRDDTPGHLMRRADLAMYHAKARGKGQFARYDDAMEPAA